MTEYPDAANGNGRRIQRPSARQLWDVVVAAVEFIDVRMGVGDPAVAELRELLTAPIARATAKKREVAR